MELIECKPYNARITPKACWMRYRKAGLLKRLGKTRTLEFMSIEKCLECGKGREMKAEDLKDSQAREVTMQCKRCGRKEPEVKIVNKKELCYSCNDVTRRYERMGKEPPPFRGQKPRKNSSEAIAPPEPAPTEEMIVKVDMRAFPAIFERLKEKAHREIRSLEHQIIFILKETLGEDR